MPFALDAGGQAAGASILFYAFAERGEAVKICNQPDCGVT